MDINEPRADETKDLSSSPFELVLGLSDLRFRLQLSDDAVQQNAMLHVGLQSLPLGPLNAPSSEEVPHLSTNNHIPGAVPRQPCPSEPLRSRTVPAFPLSHLAVERESAGPTNATHKVTTCRTCCAALLAGEARDGA